MDDITVEVRDVNLVRRGIIQAEYLDLRMTLRDLAVGEWAVRLPSDHPMAAWLKLPGSGLIVTHRDPAVGVLMSGPRTVPDDQATQADPTGTLVVSGVSDDVVLWNRVAYPTPSTADVTAQTSAYDVRSGAAETVMRSYVSVNLGPAAPVARRIPGFTLAPDLARGGSVTRSARWDRLGDLLAEVAALAGLGFRVVQIGDHLEFQVTDPVDRTGLIRLDLLTGTLASRAATSSPPTVTRAIVAGQGQGSARTFVERSNAAAESDWGPFGRIERYVDSRNTNITAELQQAGDKVLVDGEAAAAVKVVPGDGQSMPWPQTWNVGDRVAIVVGDIEETATVSAVTVLVNKSGVKVGASVGDVSGWTPTAAVERAQAATDARVSALERTAEVATSFDAASIVSGVLAGARIGGAWTPWSPGLASSGPLTASGRYIRVGRMVFASYQMVLGSGFAGAGLFQMSLPVPPNVLGITTGHARFYDSSTGNAYLAARAAVGSGGVVTFQLTSGFGGSLFNVGATQPWTWASGDIIDGFIIYEAAGD